MRLSYRLHYVSCLSVRLSVCPVQLTKRKTKRHRKTRVGGNVLQGRSNRLSVQKVSVTGC